jgi:dihydroxyacetone kinase-like predicted kinase
MINFINELKKQDFKLKTIISDFNEEGEGEKKIVKYTETFSESRIIAAANITQAKQIMNEEMSDQYNIEESWRIVTLKSVKFNSLLSVDEPIILTEIKTMKMKQLGTEVLDYDFIKEYKDFLQTGQDYGTCVIDNFIGMYGDKLKITRDQLINIIKKYYKSTLSGIDGLYLDEWEIEVGVDLIFTAYIFVKCLIYHILCNKPLIFKKYLKISARK